jgi:hypothetical protein
VRLTGWASDPDIPTGVVAVHVWADGAPVAAIGADRTATGVAGPHAFDALVPMRSPGSHTVCAYAINVGEGSTNPHLGCRTVVVPASGFDPSGTLDPLRRTGIVVTVSGAVGDPDASAPVELHVYVDGAGRAILRATGADAGDGRRRFSGDLTVPAGRHTVCVYAINQGHGTTNPQLPCRTVDVPASAYDPVGALTSVTAAGGGATVTGWASDPDAPDAPVTVHVYVDGAGAAILSAGRTAAGVTGPHAYEAQLALPAGTHQVCTYAINIGTGTTNPHLGCRTVQV